MKITNVRAMVTNAITVGFVAGAIVMMAPAKAEAQQFSFGVNVGAPYYEYRGYDERARYEQYRRQQEYLREQAYARQQAFAQHEAWEQHERHEAWEHRGFDDRHDEHRDWDDRR